MPITDLIPWKRKEREAQEVERAPQRAEHPLLTFQEEMNRLFDGFFGRSALEPFGASREAWAMFSPRVDIAETEHEVVVSAELPGLDDEDIDVSLSPGMLTISGEKKHESEERGRNTYRAERSFGAFRRSVRLPAEVEADKVDAVFRKGVLTVTLPKKDQGQARKRIEIKAR
jgi:HSP20 family protein